MKTGLQKVVIFVLYMGVVIMVFTMEARVTENVVEVATLLNYSLCS